MQRVTAIAAAAVLCVTGIKGIEQVVKLAGKRAESTITVAGKDSRSSWFVMKVYAEGKLEQISEEKEQRILLAEGTDCVSWSKNGSYSSIVIRMPLICEGDDIESVTYQFEDTATIFARDYYFPDEYKERMQNDAEMYNTEEGRKELARQDEAFRNYCDSNNLLRRISIVSEEKPAVGVQKLDSTIEVSYEEQQTEGLYFILTDYGDLRLKDENGVTDMREYLRKQVLLITAYRSDGSSSTQKYGFDMPENGDNSNCSYISPVQIYELGNES